MKLLALILGSSLYFVSSLRTGKLTDLREHEYKNWESSFHHEREQPE